MQNQALELQKANNKATWNGAIIAAIIGAVVTLIATQPKMIKYALSKIWQWWHQ